MFGFGKPRDPAPDPVGDLCRLLTARPGEWEPSQHRDRNLGLLERLTHAPSGVSVVWEQSNKYRVWVSSTPTLTGSMCLTDSPATQILVAVQTHLVARTALTPASFEAAAKQLAEAVLAANPVSRELAAALADSVKESLGL